MTLRQLSVVRSTAGLMSAEILDISEGGIALASDDPLPDRGSVQLCCPGVLCTAHFEVVQRRDTPSGYLAGARLQLAERERERFRSYLRFVARRAG